jgi:hypothetical protein
MNCEPGDLAILVRSIRGQEGRLVLVESFAGDMRYSSGRFGANSWHCHGVGTPLFGERKVGYSCIPDADLRPIRDPGDDAVDETLLRLPAPAKETA